MTVGMVDRKDRLTKEEYEICPIVESLIRIKSIWRLVVIRYLLDGPKGFNELLRMVPRLNPKTLSRTLKALQEEGLIERNIVNTRPFLVRYQLTQKGLELEPTLASLREWGDKWVMNGRKRDGNDN